MRGGARARLGSALLPLLPIRGDGEGGRRRREDGAVPSQGPLHPAERGAGAVVQPEGRQPAAESRWVRRRAAREGRRGQERAGEETAAGWLAGWLAACRRSGAVREDGSGGGGVAEGSVGNGGGGQAGGSAVSRGEPMSRSPLRA